MALLSQLFGHTALNAAVRVISATLVSTMTLLEPLIAALLAAWVFGERLGAPTALGAVVVLGAIALALRGEARDAEQCGIDTHEGVLRPSDQPLPARAERVNDGRGHERESMVETTPRWLDGRLRLDAAVEIAPPHWVDDDELVALEHAHEPFFFERFGDGTLLVSPPTGGMGGIRSGRLAAQVIGWADSVNCGVAFGPTAGFKFPDRALLAPDATFIAAERWYALPPDVREAFPTIVPDACFEMMSKSDRIRTALKKIATYLRFGVRLVVLVDPYRRRVYVGRAGDADARDLGDVDRVDCGDVMPGFVLDVAALRPPADRA
jgi:Uma2 family endonuclease